MNEIPSVYWMILIGVIAFMFCLVLYYVAMLLKETKKTVEDGRTIMVEASKTLKQVDLIINDIQTSVSTIRGSIEEVNQAVLVPIRKLGNGISLISGFLGGFLSKKEEEK